MQLRHKAHTAATASSSLHPGNPRTQKGGRMKAKDSSRARRAVSAAKVDSNACNGRKASKRKRQNGHVEQNMDNSDNGKFEESAKGEASFAVSLN